MITPLKIGQPRFLSPGEVLTLHRASIDAYGGADGVLDQGKLDSSLAMPQQGFSGEYAHEFPFTMAAAYGYHLAMSHAFRDGNKRTAFAAMVVFLRMNGWNFELPDETAAELMLELITEHRDKAWLAERLQSSSRPRVSFELRDFFAWVNSSELRTWFASMPPGTDAELDATLAEAITAIPVIGSLLQAAKAADETGDQAVATRRRTMAMAYAAVFRLAENKGYEW